MKIVLNQLEILKRFGVISEDYSQKPLDMSVEVTDYPVKEVNLIPLNGRILHCIRFRDKIGAIRLVREEYGCDLKQAKEFVESLETLVP